MNRKTYITEYDEDDYIDVCPTKKDFIEWANIILILLRERLYIREYFFLECVDFSKLNLN